MKCICKSEDRYDCWALRYHHHTAVPAMTIDEEGGPCECSCHDEYDLDPRTPEFGVAP